MEETSSQNSNLQQQQSDICEKKCNQNMEIKIPLVQTKPNPFIFCKGVGKFPSNFESSETKNLSWNILKEDVSLPAAVIELSKLEHNLAWMQNFVDQYGVKLAPHGKTTMCPQLFHRQIKAGAWGMSFATSIQVKVAHDFGIRRILMVNQLMGKRNMEIISEILSPEFEFACIVDSAENINQLGKFFQEKGQVLRVLLEIGIPGGRTGLRNSEQESGILEALDKWPNSIHLIGVELYEGILDSEESIRQYVNRAAERLKKLHTENAGRFRENRILITGAGTNWYDIVAEELSKAFREPRWPSSEDNNEGPPTSSVEIVLRAGCYITNDAGCYKRAQIRISSSNEVAKKIGTTLVPAFRIWAYVQSVPEPELAIVAFGKRDTGTDSGLPIPALHYRPSFEKPVPASENWTVKEVMDQHVFLKIESGCDISIGDMMAFDIVHPCTNFDKWKSILLVNDDCSVVDILQTYF